MANQLEIPIINPLHFVPVTPNISPRYNTRFYEDYSFADTIEFFQEQIDFFLPWQKNDPIRLQMTSNFEPLFLDLQDTEGNSMLAANMSQVRANKYQPGFYLYEANMSMADLNDGLYRVILTPGANLAAAQKSEWFYVSDVQKPSILLEYYNTRYHADVVFETGIQFSLRIPAYMKGGAPGSLDVLYRDQVYNQTQLSSKTFDNFTLFCGDGRGIPMWLIQKINMAMSCDTVLYDGKQLQKQDSAKWNEFSEDDYPMTGYSMALVPAINRYSKIINPDIDPNKKVTLIYQVGSDVFGSVDNQGGAIVTPLIGLE
jgi:hypothetical protein